MSTIIAFPTMDRGATVRPVILPEVEVEHQPLRLCADWQADIAAECRRQRTLNPGVFHFLKSAGLLDRCTFCASDKPGGPLILRHIGVPTLEKLGRAWGRSMLGHPLDESPHAEFAHSVEAQYGAAISSGELLLNRVEVHGIGAPFAYTHLLVGWEDSRRRAVLSAIDLQQAV